MHAAASRVAGRLRELGAARVPRGRRPSTRSHPAGLTTREAEVLQLLGEGLRNAEIGRRLFVSANLNPVGRVYYEFSTLLCTPCSRSQEVGLCLGAQAGEARIRQVVTAGGLTRFRRAAETPFNVVYEARA